MTLYLIGLGLDMGDISLKAIEICKKAKVYLESYTVNFLYNIDELEKIIGKRIEKLERKDVESDRLVKEAKNKDIVLLVYGSPLVATTHTALISDSQKGKIEIIVLHSSSIITAISETGLQLYKFGKITNITEYAESFINVIKENKKINGHTLILVDIGIGSKDALEKLKNAAEKSGLEINKVIICSRLGTSKRKIRYGKIDKLIKEKFELPICIIIPAKLHFMEYEILKRFEV